MGEFIKFIQLIPIYLSYLWSGLIVTLEATVISYCIAIILGFIISILKIKKRGLLFIISSIYVDIFRRVPLIVQIVTWYFIVLYMDIKIDIFIVGVIAITLNKSAYLSEIFRGAIQSIGKGQWEAGKAIGMSNSMVIRRIILPQALRVALPDLMNYLIMILIDTSLLALIGVREIFSVGKMLVNEYVQIYIFFIVGMFYLFLSFPLSKIGGWFEKKWEKNINYKKYS